MLKVVVSGELVHGTDRGGEDLLLVFEAKVLLQGALPFEQGCAIELELSEDFVELKGSTPPATSPLFKLEMGEYGFFWKGTKEDLRDLVFPELFLNDNWSRPGFAGAVCLFEFKKLVAGNAD